MKIIGLFQDEDDATPFEQGAPQKHEFPLFLGGEINPESLLRKLCVGYFATAKSLDQKNVRVLGGLSGITDDFFCFRQEYTVIISEQEVVDEDGTQCSTYSIAGFVGQADGMEPDFEGSFTLHFSH